LTREIRGKKLRDAWFRTASNLVFKLIEEGPWERGVTVRWPPCWKNERRGCEKRYRRTKVWSMIKGTVGKTNRKKQTRVGERTSESGNRKKNGNQGRNGEKGE